MKNDIKVSGPYYDFSKPYGTFTTLERDIWFVNRKLSKKEQKTEFQKITGQRCLGSIVCFRRHPNRFVIEQLHPTKAFKTLKGAVNFLIKNEGKLIFCT